ncbi:molybdopterin-synthase adenylyltransferase MoeB [Angustibacter sp. Root456]|uniref:molybdopterin-synthase adenylyltransferase MoeB n=1 Tax=Angustibacter sp. Root456 TaxID=1736539 RepID=UPI0006F7F21D|nr:molybdopterin-synthase adenylyltransferase MoeB [Angustibacter sp. Root456]KQX69845.1 molybdopterin biosynthesis-like protein MoeZ [Angustibacter sp. Root456]
MSLPPLVDPGPPLDREQVARYARHLLIPDVGELGQRRLTGARIAVVGAGGLGSPALLYLAAAGVGTIGVIDPDVVEASNLQRQVVHGASDVGRRKVDSAADAIAEVNPLVRVVRHPVRLDSSNALDVLAGYDLVVDGTDNFATRYLVNDACVLLGVPCVWGSIYRFDGQVSVFWGGHGPCYRCLFPDPPPPGSVPSCAEGGVLGLLCAAIGAAQGTEVVKLVVGMGEPLLGRLLVHDALRASWRELRVRPDPQCPVCGEHPTITRDTGLIDYEQFCGLPPVPERRDGALVAPAELAELLAARERGESDLVLVDVREPGERAIVSIPGAVAVPRAAFDTGEAFEQIPFDRPVVLHCRSGVRSAAALDLLRAAGHPDARHLDGGVLAWVEQVDPSLPTY